MELAQKAFLPKQPTLLNTPNPLKEQMHQQAKQLEDAKSEQTKLQN